MGWCIPRWIQQLASLCPECVSLRTDTKPNPHKHLSGLVKMLTIPTQVSLSLISAPAGSDFLGWVPRRVHVNRYTQETEVSQPTKESLEWLSFWNRPSTLWIPPLPRHYASTSLTSFPAHIYHFFVCMVIHSTSIHWVSGMFKMCYGLHWIILFIRFSFSECPATNPQHLFTTQLTSFMFQDLDQNPFY